MACSAVKPEAFCSDEGTLKALRELGYQHLDESGYRMAGLDVRKAKIDIDAIRTRHTDERSAICAADMSFMPIEPKQAFLKKESLIHVLYRVEMLDKAVNGQNIYVSAEGLW